MTTGKRLAMLLAVVLAPLAVHANELATIEAALAAPVFPAELPLNEMKSFLEPRIAQPVVMTTVDEWQQRANSIRREMLERIVFRGRAAAWQGLHLPRAQHRHGGHSACSRRARSPPHGGRHGRS